MSELSIFTTLPAVRDVQEGSTPPRMLQTLRTLVAEPYSQPSSTRIKGSRKSSKTITGKRYIPRKATESEVDIVNRCTFLLAGSKSEVAELTDDLLRTSHFKTPITLHNKLPHRFNFETHFRRKSRGFYVRILESKTSLDPVPDCSAESKLFLVAHAQSFDVFLEYLGEKPRRRSIQTSINGIAVLQSSDSKTAANLPNALVDLDSRFNNSPPPTWVQVESGKINSGTLAKGILELQKVLLEGGTHEHVHRSENAPLNFKPAAEFLKEYIVQVRRADPDDADTEVTTSTEPRSKIPRGSTWHAGAQPSSRKPSSGIPRISTFPRVASDSSGPRPAHSLSGFEALLQRADTYHSRGQLPDAEACYRDVLRKEIPSTTRYSARVSLAVIDLQKGRHLQAGNALDLIIKETSATILPTTTTQSQLDVDSSLLQDAILRRATARARLGLYLKVFKDLKQLVKLSRTELLHTRESDDPKTEVCLAFNRSGLDQKRRPDSEVSRDASIARLWALSASYSGFSYKDCLEMLAAAETICSWIETRDQTRDEQALARAEDSDQQPLRDSLGLRIAIQLTGAKIHMMQGNLSEARRYIKEASAGAKEKIPSFSALALEVELVSAHLYTLTHHFAEARQLCRQIAALTSKFLGDGHLFQMEADWILILSVTFQGRYAESMIMSQSLCDRAATSVCLQPLHPLTLKYKSQLAGIYLRLGYYRRAEGLLQILCAQSQELWPDLIGRPNPSTLRYLSQLALAQSFNGKTNAAEQTVQKALLFQPWPSRQDSNNKPRATLDCRRVWAGAASVNSDKCLHHHDKSWLDPDTKLSILIRCFIEFSKKLVDPECIHSIRCAGEYELSAPGYPSASETQVLLGLTIGQVDSAMAMSAGDGTLKKYHAGIATETLLFVAQNRGQLHSGGLPVADTTQAEQTLLNPPVKGDSQLEPAPELLPTYHPLLIAARRDLHAIRCFMEPVRPWRLYAVKSDLKAILKAQEINPGWAHPDTLQTILCLLATVVALDSAKSNETDCILDDLQRRLNSNMMRQQYALQRLCLLENITGLLSSIPSYADKAQGFLADPKDSELGGKIERDLDHEFLV